METAREILRPFRSDNGHFEFDFWFFDELLNKGDVTFTYLKSSRKPDSYGFEIGSGSKGDVLRINAILIADPGGHTGGINKPLQECVEFLKTSISDLSAIHD